MIASLLSGSGSPALAPLQGERGTDGALIPEIFAPCRQQELLRLRLPVEEAEQGAAPGRLTSPQANSIDSKRAQGARAAQSSSSLRSCAACTSSRSCSLSPPASCRRLPPAPPDGNGTRQGSPAGSADPAGRCSRDRGPTVGRSARRGRRPRERSGDSDGHCAPRHRSPAYRAPARGLARWGRCSRAGRPLARSAQDGGHAASVGLHPGGGRVVEAAAVDGPQKLASSLK